MGALSWLAMLPLASAAQEDVTVEVDMGAVGRSFPQYWRRSFGSGHASLGLREDWQAALARGAADYGLSGIRQHGIFDDDLGIASRQLGSLEIMYNFSKLDVLWDAHVAHGVHPVVELSFMPTALANCSSHQYPHPDLPPCPPQTWVRTGVPWPPRRWSDWHDLVKRTVGHAVARYGLSESMRAEYAGPPLLCVLLDSEMWGVPGGSETAVGIYTSTFYAEAAKAVKEVDASLRVGGPAAADPVILASFINQAETLHLPLDFVSYHQYGNPRQCGAGWTSGYASGSADPVSKTGYYWDPHCFKTLFEWARRQVPKKYPIYVTEYSVSVGETQVDHDTSNAAAFIMRLIGELDGIVEVLSYWAFSDIFEEIGLPPSEFSGFYGLETYHGIAKPVRRAFECLFRYTGPTRLPTTVSLAKLIDTETKNAMPGRSSMLSSRTGSCAIVADLGCFDQLVGRDRTCFNISDQSSMGYGSASVDNCLDYCWRNRAADNHGDTSVSYIGLESGYQCWCSSHPPGQGNHSACPRTPIDECNAACGVPPPPFPPDPPLPPNETCGGGWRLRAYKVRCSKFPQPPPRRRPGDTIAAFATTSENDGSTNRQNVSVFISSWDSSLPPQGSPVAHGKPEPVSVAVNLKFASGVATRILDASVIKIDESHANPRAAYLKMNTTWPNAVQLKELQAASAVAEDSLTVSPDGRRIELHVPPNAAYTVLIQLTEGETHKMY